MNLPRIVRHLLMPPWRVRTAFPAPALHRIEAAIRAAEAAHAGQIRFAVEAALDSRSLLRVWDTERNNGVLIYLLLADRDVEIVADRGVHGHVGAPEWERICREMEALLRAARFEEGVITGIQAVSAHLARHYPGPGKKPNELPDVPVIL